MKSMFRGCAPRSHGLSHANAQGELRLLPCGKV
jgi:hypothetical protein